MEIVPISDQVDPPPSLNTMSLELRVKVLKNLLINLVLGKLESMMILEENRKRVQDVVYIKHRLHPEVSQSLSTELQGRM